MVPRKLIETLFRNKLALVLPVIIVPLVVMSFSTSQPSYRSTATIWVSDPVDSDALLGHMSAYHTPAQNQAIVVSDLLSTRAFRLAVMQRAGFMQNEDDPAPAYSSIWAGATGVNLLQIGAVTSAPDVAPRIVQAVIDEYLARATDESKKGLEGTSQYYRTQLGVAELELEERRGDLATFLAANPSATLTGRTLADLQYQALQANVDYQTRVVQELANQIQSLELRLSSSPDSQRAAFSMQDAPVTPVAPLPVSVTRRFGMPLAAVLFGVLISAAFIFVRYRSDHSLASFEDLSGLAVVPLGVVPELTAPGLIRRIPLVRRLPWTRQSGFARRTARGIGNPIEESLS
ncbi:MAG: hypothetical protein IT303_02090 [Dehalococcoidia bacterium]|nr:hypothetical protein [Dehalococcoidia bacterium]